MKQSFFSSSLLAAGMLLTGGAATASLDLSVYNMGDSEQIPSINLFESAGQSMQSGFALLGYMNGDWAFSQDDTGHISWSNGGHSYAQDALTYSQIVSIKNSFTNSLSNISPDEGGSVTNGGAFSLSGSSDYTGTNEIVLMVFNEEQSKFSLFTFKSTNGADFASYPGHLNDYLAFDFVSKQTAIEQELDWYVECVLGRGNAESGFILIPEPATATLGLMGLAALLMRRRR